MTDLTDDTLGSLCDKLSIINVKLFSALDDQFDLQNMAKNPDMNLMKSQIDQIYAEIGKIAEKVQGLNSHRNDLIDMIDAFVEKAIAGDIKIRRPKFKKYGTAKEIAKAFGIGLDECPKDY